MLSEEFNFYGQIISTAYVRMLFKIISTVSYIPIKLHLTRLSVIA